MMACVISEWLIYELLRWKQRWDNCFLSKVQEMLSNMPQNIRFVEVIFEYELNNDAAVGTGLTWQSSDVLFPYSIVLETVHSRC